MNTSETDDCAAQTILRLVNERGEGKSICPTEAARALAAEGEDFRRHLNPVRSAAAHLARQGRLSILRKGKPIDPDAIHGVIRLSLPRPK